MLDQFVSLRPLSLVSPTKVSNAAVEGDHCRRRRCPGQPLKLPSGEEGYWLHMGDDSRTIENTREHDETVCKPDDDEEPGYNASGFAAASTPGEAKLGVVSPLIEGMPLPVLVEVSHWLAVDEAYGVVGLRLIFQGRVRLKAGAIKIAHYGFYVKRSYTLRCRSMIIIYII
ncbi:hypothetical protein AAZX31_07G165200 [Glycine max]|uniref:Uncharacterized protein n=2 Tax=Glycine subgen. Soja TaxID=1462606 RepID=A0A0R0J4L0_SOYBN